MNMSWKFSQREVLGRCDGIAQGHIIALHLHGHRVLKGSKDSTEAN